MQLNLSNISYTYEGAVSPALDRVSVTFPQGWTGIIGDNGCGKSTLARVATGLIVPDEGSVAPTLFAAYCPQDTSIVPAELSDLATDWGSEALQIRDALGIEDAFSAQYRRHQLRHGGPLLGQEQALRRCPAGPDCQVPGRSSDSDAGRCVVPEEPNTRARTRKVRWIEMISPLPEQLRQG